MTEVPVNKTASLKLVIIRDTTPNSIQTPVAPIHLSQVMGATTVNPQQHSQPDTVPAPSTAPTTRKRGTKYTLEYFHSRVREIHGDKFDHSAIRREHLLEGIKSRIPVTCNACKYSWSPTVNGHINLASGCPDCAGKIPWNLERLLSRVKVLYGGDRFDYSQIRPKHINQGQYSYIPVRCKICDYAWSPPIRSHVYSEHGCPSCSGKVPWTYERFMKKAPQLHGNKFDYSAITPECIKDAESQIPLKCNICGYHWNSTVHSHIGKRIGCPNCSEKAPWTYERFIKQATELHGDRVDYDLVKAEYIVNVQSHIPLRCNTCKYHWSPSIHHHINVRTGCPRCKKSKGEKECADILDSLSISFETDIPQPFMPKKRYDFKFEHNGSTWFLEFDGEQHFRAIEHFDRDPLSFEKRQQSDIMKTKAVLENGHKMIRIDHTKLGSVREHIVKALAENGNLYVTDPALYSYITDVLVSQ